MDIHSIFKDTDFHTFVMERRDGTFFTGTVYKTRTKAMSVAHTYMKNDPYTFRRACIVKLGVESSEVYDNLDFIENETIARAARDRKIQDEANETIKEMLDEANEIFRRADKMFDRADNIFDSFGKK